MAQDPAFLFYYKDILVSCADMDADALGWYTRLLCHQADKPDGLPNNIEDLASLANVKIRQYERFIYCWEHILKGKFVLNDKGMLINVVQAEGLEKRRNYKNTQQKRGMVGAFLKKNYGVFSLSKEQWSEVSKLLIQSILPLDDKEEINNTLKHTLEAYALSIKGNAIGNGNANVIQEEIGGTGEKEGAGPEPGPELHPVQNLILAAMLETWMGVHPDYEPIPEDDEPAMEQIALFITGRKDLSDIGKKERETLLSTWKNWCLHIRGSTTLQHFSLSKINRFYKQQIVSELKNPKNGAIKPAGTQAHRPNHAAKPVAGVVPKGGFGSL